MKDPLYRIGDTLIYKSEDWEGEGEPADILEVASMQHYTGWSYCNKEGECVREEDIIRKLCKAT